MGHSRALVAAGAAVLALNLGAVAPRAARADVQACTVIPVELLDKLDSGTAQVGDRFHFRAIDTVLTHDEVLIAKGTVGYGLITFVQAAAAHARPGQLMPEARYFALPHNKEYQVTVDYNATHVGKNGNAPGIVGAAPIPFLGVAVGAFNYFHPGSNITIPIGFQFAVMPVGSLGGTTPCQEVQPGIPQTGAPGGQ